MVIQEAMVVVAIPTMVAVVVMLLIKEISLLLVGLNISGAIKETIEDSLFIIKHKGAIKYYAPYIDKNNLVHVISVTENENEVDILKSNYEPFNLKRLSDLLNVEKRDLLYIKMLE